MASRETLHGARVSNGPAEPRPHGEGCGYDGARDGARGSTRDDAHDNTRDDARASTRGSAIEPFVRPPLAEPTASAYQMYAVSAAFALGTALVAALAAVYVGIGCPSDTPLLKVLCTDTHYKYLVPLLIPVTAWFAIANWVGWQYFRYS